MTTENDKRIQLRFANGYEEIINGDDVCKIHQLVAIAEGHDPYKVFSRSHHVHHINEIEWDNRPENLQLLSRSEHLRMHKMKKKYEERRREMKLDGERVDRRPGNGSGQYSDDAFDDENPEDLYQASKAKTTFNSREGGEILRSDGSRISFGRLFRMHHDVHRMTNDGARFAMRKDSQHMSDLCDIVASQLELTEVQRDRLHQYVEEAPMSQGGPLSTEELVLAASTIAANKDDRWLRREDEYIQLQSDFDIENEQVKKGRQFLREHVLK